MDNFIFALSMTLVGMGGTLLSLWILTLSIDLLKKIFPYNKARRHKKS